MLAVPVVKLMPPYSFPDPAEHRILLRFEINVAEAHKFSCQAPPGKTDHRSIANDSVRYINRRTGYAGNLCSSALLTDARMAAFLLSASAYSSGYLPDIQAMDIGKGVMQRAKWHKLGAISVRASRLSS